MQPKERPSKIRESLHAILTHPVKLRASIAVGFMVLWYFAVYQPLAGQIDAATKRVQKERKRLDLARGVEKLKSEETRLRRFLPGEDDKEAWVQYLMAGLRGFPLKLLSLDPQAPVDVGPYKAVSLRVVVEGPYGDLEKFLRWLETCERLVRIDSLQFDMGEAGKARPGARSPDYRMQLVVMSIAG